MDRGFRTRSSRHQPTSEPEGNALDPFEVRLVAEAKIEKLADFAASARLHATDTKGDTPLHLAARTGNLAVCDLFIRAGANPNALNFDQQTPADVAFLEGHQLVAQLLSSLLVKPVEVVRGPEVSSDADTVIARPDRSEPIELGLVVQTESDISDYDLDDFLNFEPEVYPEEFLDQHAAVTASGTFVAIVSLSPVVSGEDDSTWDLDLTPAPILGEGIGSSTFGETDLGAENDFLKVRGKGKRSTKKAIVQTGTRISIDDDLCLNWAEEILSKGYCTVNDIDRLVACSEGNADLEDLHANIRRNLEAAGFDIDPEGSNDVGLWDVASDISSSELAEAIEAALTRWTRLPGTQRFVMDKSHEDELLEPMMRAKEELQLGILASADAVEIILGVMDNIRSGAQDPNDVSLKTVIPSRPDHAETAEVMAAADALRAWHTTGRVLDGKRRREALAALDALDLSLAFQKELIRKLQQLPASLIEASQLDAEMQIAEFATNELIRQHLPYVRRFAARNVGPSEDPEEVFQVAFMGLQRSTRRFDPERGYRFLIYATYWMRQAITRWRSDEGAAIRIPVHRSEKITKLDYALEKLDVRVDGVISDHELAQELEWPIEEVRHLRVIPREAEYPETLNDWDKLFPEPLEVDVLNQAETERIVANALADLPERQADVIRMRFGIGLDSEMTLEEIGQIYGVTRERIRQIEAKALEKLSHPGRMRRFKELLGLDGARKPKNASSTEREQPVPAEPNDNSHIMVAWSENRVDRLRELWAAGMSASAIARELGGTSRNAVIGKLSRLGLADFEKEQGR